MTGAGDLLEHVHGLLAAGEWEVAALHVRHAAQVVPSRDVACQWRALCAQVPELVRGGGSWPEALAWVGARTDDVGLVREAVQVAFPGRVVFRAWLAARAERWLEVLQLLAGTGELPGLPGVLGARLRAGALFELGDPGAEEAFAEALAAASGRDRGLIFLDLAYYRSRVRHDREARDAYAKALAWLKGDVSELTLAHANLGIACLHLNDVQAAELAFRDALRYAGLPGGERHLSTVWRLAGGVGMQRNLPARAVEAYQRAFKAARDIPERLLAVRGLGRALMAARAYDQALAALYDGLREVRSERHPLWLDVAALLLRAGNQVGAREALERAESRSDSDCWRQRVLQAEFLRQAGQDVPRDFLHPWPTDGNWVREEAQLFPELFALLNVRLNGCKPRAVVVADGPIRALLDDIALPLASHRHAAALLAFLVAHGGSSTTERALEALQLPGKTFRARQQELSRAVSELRGVLGWPAALLSKGGLLHLTPDIHWEALTYPPAERADLFCEGRLDPWVIEWRQQHLSP